MAEIDDAVLATAAVARLGLLRTDRWPIVAAHLIALGFDGPDLVALASLSESASGWEVDQLVPGVLNEIHAPQLDVARAGEIYVRIAAQMLPADYSVIRTLATLAPEMDYPGGAIGEAYQLNEFLDCECHRDQGRPDADDFLSRIRASHALELPDDLMAALACF